LQKKIESQFGEVEELIIRKIEEENKREIYELSGKSLVNLYKSLKGLEDMHKSKKKNLATSQTDSKALMKSSKLPQDMVQKLSQTCRDLDKTSNATCSLFRKEKHICKFTEEKKQLNLMDSLRQSDIFPKTNSENISGIISDYFATGRSNKETEKTQIATKESSMGVNILKEKYSAIILKKSSLPEKTVDMLNSSLTKKSMEKFINLPKNMGQINENDLEISIPFFYQVNVK